MANKVDIVIVGSGPAGLSAAARAAQRGLSHLLLEKTDHLSDTIYKYQRGKHIMATPDILPIRSDVPFAAGSREEILEQWDRRSDEAGIQIRLKSEVVAIHGQQGDFRLQLSDDDSVQARWIVLAIGVQGNPNRLTQPGTDQDWVHYQLDDPKAVLDESILVIGGGDAGIENALGLAADPHQGNTVSLLQRADGFPRAKAANVKALYHAQDEGRIQIHTGSTLNRVEAGGSGEARWIAVIDTSEGEARIPVDRIIARLGATAPRKFLEAAGVEFSGPDREAFPVLSPQYQSSVAGLFIVGALAGYPLIKHCLNQGHDVVEFIAGNTELEPPDTPLLREILSVAEAQPDVEAWIARIQQVPVFAEASALQLREFLLFSQMRRYSDAETIFQRNDSGTSIYVILEGAVSVHIDPNDASKRARLDTGTLFGELALISGRKRTATIEAAGDTLLLDVPRTAMLRLMAAVPGVKRQMDRLSTWRQVGQLFGRLLPPEAITRIVDAAEAVELKAGETVIAEGEQSTDIYIIRTGSLVVEKTIGGQTVFLSYVPAGNYVGEMALFYEGRRTASVRAAIKSSLVKLPGPVFEQLLASNPQLRDSVEAQLAKRMRLNDYVEAQSESFGSVVEMHTSVANFLLQEGFGEATDALIIDETLCVACDNCETACAEVHDGISRLDREAGNTYAHIHVPTSCRHCAHPHCMTDCPPDAIHRGPDGEVFIDDSCIGCGNCARHCPYGVIQIAAVPPPKPGLLAWLGFGLGPGPGEPSAEWTARHRGEDKPPKKAVKCDMCKGIDGGPACVRACPTGAALRISPDDYLHLAQGAGGNR